MQYCFSDEDEDETDQSEGLDDLDYTEDTKGEIKYMYAGQERWDDVLELYQGFGR